MIYSEYISFFRENLVKIENPSILIEMIFDYKLNDYFPEIVNLKGCLQDKEWHPEGDVLAHTLLVTDKAKELCMKLNDNSDKEKLLLFAICHDLGKPATTIFKDNRWRSPAHEIKGLPIARIFLEKFQYPEETILEVLKYVKDHLTLIHFYKDRDRITDKAIIRLINRVNIFFLLYCVKSDYFGRTNMDESIDSFKPELWIFERINQIKINKKRTNFLNGKILLLLGFKPGKQIGEILREAEILEKENVLNNQDQAIDWAKTKLIS
jgi:tRNA nucleotidyltransferase (CCA-adding enzyme)